MSIRIHHKKEERFWVSLLIFFPLLILIASLSNSISFLNFSAPFNKLWLNQLCHTHPDRAFYVFGEPMIICARCTGIYFSLAAGISCSFFISLRVASARTLKIILTLSILVILIDVVGNYFLVWENTNTTRFLTGVLFGASLSSFFFGKK